MTLPESAPTRSPRRFAGFGGRVATTVGFFVAASLSLWIGDAVAVYRAHRTMNVTSLVSGLAVGLHVTLVTAVVLGLLVGPVRWLFDRGVRVRAPVVLPWLLGGGLPVQHERSAVVLATLASALLFAGGSYLVLHEIVQNVTQHHFMAILGAAAALVWLVVLAVSFGFQRRIARAFVATIARVPGLRALVSRSGIVTLLIVVAAAAATAGVMVKFWVSFRLLPWSMLLRVLGAAVGASLAWLLAPRIANRSWLVGGAFTTLLALLVATGVPASQVEYDSWNVRRLAFVDSLSGRTAMKFVALVGDFDRDGRLSLLGGGDCAPWDARRYRGAIEVPGNGVDEDCSGQDMAEGAEETRGRWGWPLPSEVPRRPPIVLITVDAFSAAHLGSMGYERDPAPNIDALAGRSAFFSSAFSQGPSTRLSFPSMWTSRWDSQLERVRGRRQPFSLAAGERTLAQHLARDYDTACVVPNVYFTPGRWRSTTRGFRRVDRSAVGQGRHGHNAVQLTDAAIEIVEADRRKPLLLWVHYYDAHSPHRNPAGVEPFGPREKDKYDTELRFIDGQVGRLLEAIDENLEDPLIILTSDHAEAFHPNPVSRRSHYGYDLYSATLHVPLIMNASWIPPRRVENVASTMDILPTIMNVLRRGPDQELYGTSLVPELLGGENPNRVLFSQFYLFERVGRSGQSPLELVSLRTDQHNLVFNRKEGIYEMYDYRQDYYETNNLLDGLRPPREFAPLRERLAHYVQAVYDYDEE